MSKICKMCQDVYDKNYFYKNGRSICSICKECHKIRNRKFYLKYKEKIDIKRSKKRAINKRIKLIYKYVEDDNKLIEVINKIINMFGDLEIQPEDYFNFNYYYENYYNIKTEEKNDFLNELIYWFNNFDHQ